MRTLLALGAVLLAGPTTAAQPPKPAPGSAVLKVRIKGVKVERGTGAEVCVFELETLGGEALAEARIPRNRTWTFRPKGKAEVVQSVERVMELHKTATPDKPATVWAFGRDTAGGKPSGIVIYQFYHEDVSAKWEQPGAGWDPARPPDPRPAASPAAGEAAHAGSA